MKIFKAFVLICFSTILFSCGGSQTKTITIPATLTAEGPFFEGANSLMAPIAIDLNELMEDASFKEAAAVQLMDVEITIEDENATDLGIFSNATLQFVSNTNSMTTVAILNPLVFAGNTATLVTSEEAEIQPFFQEKEFTALLDLDFKNDEYWESLSVKINMSFKVDY
jgi:hypothetical protein